jgi:nitrogen fixation protein FixH
MPAMVIGLLGGHMIFIFTAITLGTGDPSFAVVPDYYQKGVDYDDRKALLAESAQLGWVVEVVPGESADAIGQRELVVQVRDAEGQAVKGLEMKIDAYHVARASEPVGFVCVEALPGQYVGTSRMTREGFWQFTIDATSGDQRFVAELRQFVRPAGVSK